MLGLSAETVRLIEIIAVVLMIPWLSIIIAALLSRQIFRFGLDNNWGDGGQDIKINGF